MSPDFWAVEQGRLPELRSTKLAGVVRVQDGADDIMLADDVAAGTLLERTFVLLCGLE